MRPQHLIYNSRNSFGLLAFYIHKTLCIIYNSRNSFGLLARIFVRAAYYLIYNSRNSFGLLAPEKNDLPLRIGSTIVEIRLAY